MSKKTLGYVPYGTGRHQPFDQVYQRAMSVTPQDVAGGKVDALVIWGGADISPSIYGQKTAKWTGADDTLSQRDAVEVAVVKAAFLAGVPVIGVCRGAQLLCAMSGGKLIQHVNNHGRTHDVKTDEGKVLTTSSMHHQMMYPFDINHKMLAWSHNHHADQYLGEETAVDMTGKEEPEIVFFPHTKSLAIQGHPEFMDETDPFVLHCNNLIRQYL